MVLAQVLWFYSHYYPWFSSQVLEISWSQYMWQQEKQQPDFWRLTCSFVLFFIFSGVLQEELLELTSLPMSFTRNLLRWIAIVNGSTVTQPDINNTAQNKWSTKNKKQRGKTSLSFIIWCFPMCIILFSRDGEVQNKVKTLSPHRWLWRAKQRGAERISGICWYRQLPN